MIKETVKFKNLEGAQETEVMYFNLSKSRALAMVSKMSDYQKKVFTEVFTKINLAKEEKEETKHATNNPEFIFKDPLAIQGMKVYEVLNTLLSYSFGYKTAFKDKTFLLQNDETVEYFLSSESGKQFVVDLYQNDARLETFLNLLLNESLLEAIQNTDNKPLLQPVQ